MTDGGDRLLDLERENEALRQRIAALEERLATPPPDPLSVYRAFFEDLPIPTILFRRDGVVSDINRANQERLGVTREVAVDRYSILQDPEADAKGYAAGFRQALAGMPTTLAPTHYDVDKSNCNGVQGKRLYTQTSYFPVSGPSGETFIAQMSLDVTEQVRAQQAAREREGLLQSILDNSSIVVVAKDREGRIVLASRRAWESIGFTWEDLRGKTDFDLFPRDVAERYKLADQRVLETLQSATFEEDLPGPDGTRVHLYTVKFPIFDEEGNLTGTCGVSSDITEHRYAEENNRRLSEEMLRVKEAALRALSTPIIPLAEGVLVMPLIGDVDQERAAQVLEVLLRGVSQGRARVAILDLTGLTSAGPEVADVLIRVSRAVGLLGAQVVLTGIQPSLAQVLVSVGEGLSAIVTRGTLESGVTYAMQARRG